LNTTQTDQAAETTDSLKDSPDSQLVDLKVLAAAYKAASIRLGVVQRQERESQGVAKTDLTDIGRAALRTWRPSTLTKPGKRAAIVQVEALGRPAGSGGYRAYCTVCEKDATGETRSEARHKMKGHGDEHTTTFRFFMHREAYAEVKAQIRASGLSVALVVQDGLETFARTGKF
jgi:hypothetical protein